MFAGDSRDIIVQMSAVEDHIQELTIKVNQRLAEMVDPEADTLSAAIHYSLSVGGKRIRPLFFLTFLEAFGEDPDSYIDVAAAIECIHTYSLIHDDLPAMDDDDFRRNQPTVHRQFNEAIAVLTGDTLLTMAVEMITRLPMEAGTIVNILRILSFSIGLEGMAGGQARDLEFNGEKENISEIHRLKTGQLLTGTLLASAEIIGLNEAQLDQVQTMGRQIGTAFQLADDLLDWEGDEKEVGKPLRKDGDNLSPNAVIYFGRESVMEQIGRAYRICLDQADRLGINFPPFLYLLKKIAYRS